MINQKSKKYHFGGKPWTCNQRRGSQREPSSMMDRAIRHFAINPWFGFPAKMKTIYCKKECVLSINPKQKLSGHI